jgi:hypothetical protein
MSIDLDAARTFMTTHARVLDRHRFELVVGPGEADGATGEQALAALSGYRNPDGGYGWGLEPDLRAVASQPAGALHAFEAMEDATSAGAALSPHASSLCDWLASVSLPDGGLPFALPVDDPTGCAPLWTDADTTTSSLHLTSAVAAGAHRVARHDPAVAGHPWLARVTDHCLDRIAATDRPQHVLELRYILWFLDAVADVRPEAVGHLERLAATIPPSGSAHVEGGKPDEMVRPLDFSPRPDRPLRAQLAPSAVAADLERLAGEQHEDGGWDVDWVSWSPAAALEWRGWATVRAVTILVANGVT